MSEPRSRTAVQFVELHSAAVAAAAERIQAFTQRTRLLELPGGTRPLLMKLENNQVTGSFKARGAFNALLELREMDSSLTGVVAMSSGNHAKAIAHAARELDMTASVVVPADSSAAKLAAVLALGAELIVDGVTLENRDDRLRALQAKKGLPLIHPFDDWSVIHGQGTVAVEMLAEAPDLCCIAAPVGGGGLLTGIAVAAKSFNPDIQVVGVEPAVADDARRTLLTGQRVRLDHAPVTLADGVRTPQIGDCALEAMVMHGLVDEIVTVDEQELVQALRYAWQVLKLAIEPTGALPLAAYLAGKLRWPASQRGAVVLTGGNFEVLSLQELLVG